MTVEIIVHKLDGNALPQRRERDSAEPFDARLLRTIGGALPLDFPLSVELVLGSHAARSSQPAGARGGGLGDGPGDPRGDHHRSLMLSALVPLPAPSGACHPRQPRDAGALSVVAGERE